MNDLRLLYQVDKDRKIINLEFKQIATLQPLIPILNKFQNLQSLTLTGNRLKYLPNMSSLVNLVELDISNNLFNQLEDILPGLISLPKLRHLICTLKNQDEQNQIRQDLPYLERLNKKPLNNKNIIKKVKKNQMKLEEKDLQEIGQIYDDIRDVYKRSKYFADKELVTDFDKNVDLIMSDLSIKLNSAKSSTEIDSSIISCRYGLIDLCFTKVITYFYHFDKNVAVVIQKIHDYMAQLFRAMGEILKTQLDKTSYQISNIRTKKQDLFKNQIKRLKNKDDESLKKLQYFQKKYNQMLQILTQYGKESLLQNAVKGGYGQSTPLKELKMSPNKRVTSKSPRILKNENIGTATKSGKDQIDISKASKNLTLNQLKQVINQLYAAKNKHNISCFELKTPMQTMETFMYTYLNQKYGLKNITIEWAMSIVNGIKRYAPEDPEIGIFGKILRNQVEQSFQEYLKKQKNYIRSSIKKFKGTQNFEQTLSANEAQQILLNCHYKRDQISIMIPKLRQQYPEGKHFPIQRFQSALLQYLIRIHQQTIKPFLNVFKLYDKDENGILSQQQFGELVGKVWKQMDIDQILNYLDPNMTDVLTFSHTYDLLNRNQTFKQLFQKL